MTDRKILMVTSECVPFAKTGGLADVIGALPAALKAQDTDVRVIMPLYKKIKDQYAQKLSLVRWSMIRMGWRTMYSGLFTLDHGGVTYYFIDNEYYFNHDAIYLDYQFDIERFTFFQRAVLEAVGEPMEFMPDVIHCHDWQTGLIPVLIDAHYRPYGYLADVKTVYTIHNIKYQGIHASDVVADYSDLPWQYINEYGILKDGVTNFMKAGIVYANRVSTVSPSYAQEILTPFYGEGLDAVLRSYQFKLSGILNGIDVDSYNPEKDPHIALNYNPENYEDGKAAAKTALQQELSLDLDPDVPLVSMVSRLVDQKGLDLILRIIDEFLSSEEVQLVIVGTGDPHYEAELRAVESRHPDKCRSYIDFDTKLSRRVYAAGDLFLMPSISEPCGLSQMIAMRYGNVPIVRETGGLKDTVQPYNRYTGEGTGFTFQNVNAHELLYKMQEAVDLYNDNEEAFQGLITAGMTADFSWDQSARAYLDLYDKALAEQ